MSYQLKEKRIKLQSKIITMIFADNNNTVHFDYHVNIDEEEDSIRLELYTHNARHNEIFLLHQTSGTSTIAVLNKMIHYLKQHQNQQYKEKNSYTVQWKNLKEANPTAHTSYFHEFSEEAVRKKFFFNKKEADFEVSIQLNPMA